MSNGSEKGGVQMSMQTALQEFIQKPSNERLLQQERLMLEVTELLTDVMERRGVTRVELARRLGKSKAFVTQVLRGRHNMTLRTLGDFAWALGVRLHLKASPEFAWTGISWGQVHQPSLAEPSLFRYEVRSGSLAGRATLHQPAHVSGIYEVAA